MSTSIDHLTNRQISTKLFQYITNNEADKALLLLEMTMKSKNKSDLNYIINKHQHTKFNDTLLEICTRNNQYIICRELINKYKCIPTNWSLFLACSNNNFEIAKVLIENGGKPTSQSTNGSTCLYYAARHGNLTLIKLLRKAGFDFNKINSGKGQATVTAACCWHNHFECLKYIVQWSKELGNNYYKLLLSTLYKNSPDDDNCLKTCTEHGFYEISYYLINALDFLNNADGITDVDLINQCNTDGDNIIWGIAYIGDIRLMDLIAGNGNIHKANVNQCNNNGDSPLFIACKRNHAKFAQQLINHNDFDVNVLNLKNKKGETPLSAATNNGHIAVVKVLSKCKQLIIDNNALLYCCKRGQTQILKHLLKVLIFERNNNDIQIWDDFINSNILKSETVLDMINIANEQNNTALREFLIEIQSIYDSRDFNYFRRVLQFESDSFVQRNIKKRSERFSRDTLAAKTFLEGLSETTKQEINQKISEMIKNKDTLNDTLLLMQYEIDSETLNKNMIDAACDCFKTPVEKDEKDEKDEKQDDDDDDYDDSKIFKKEWFFRNVGNNNILAASNMFVNIKENVLNNEIGKQEKVIEQFWCNEEKNDYESCQQLMDMPYFNNAYYHDLQQNKYISMYDSSINRMTSKGIVCEYKENELIIDLKSGFDGAKEYDLNVVSTLLVINGYNINRQFQNELKYYFNPSKLGIECKYKSGNVKKLNRVQVKAELDYNQREYPHTMSIIDIVRGSVTCKNSKDLLAIISVFKTAVNNGQFKYVKEITRIKNGFNQLKGKKFQYCDLKMNLLVETEKDVMICELQFIVEWMLGVKKLSHTYYELLRNEEMFQQMYINSNAYDLNSSDVIKQIESAIITQDFNTLYQLLVYNQLIVKLNHQTQKQLIQLARKYFSKAAQFYQYYYDYTHTK